MDPEDDDSWQQRREQMASAQKDSAEHLVFMPMGFSSL